MSLVRALLFLAVSAVLSWHFLLRHTGEVPVLPQGAERMEMAVAPGIVPDAEPEANAAAEIEPPAEVTPEPQPAPPPPERGDPDGDKEEKNAEPIPEETKPAETSAQRARREVEQIRESGEQVEKAAEEVSGKTRQGFRTVLYSSAEDQLAIARYFGEQLVVVPRKGLDPRRPHYYLVDAGGNGDVTRIDEKAPLDRFRQYRDFFAFEYSDLPGVVRSLRRKVPIRSEIFLFAALIPPSEWAVVMARRATALENCRRELGGEARGLEDLRRVEMRYVALPGGGFDIGVKQLVFADGTRWTQHP
ncbi:MAG: hypothetical protein ACYTEG_12270 [Planctomycetota bacterium]|jgi:hypothetical protein